MSHSKHAERETGEQKFSRFKQYEEIHSLPQFKEINNC